MVSNYERHIVPTNETNTTAAAVVVRVMKRLPGTVYPEIQQGSTDRGDHFFARGEGTPHTDGDTFVLICASATS